MNDLDFFSTSVWRVRGACEELSALAIASPSGAICQLAHQAVNGDRDEVQREARGAANVGRDREPRHQRAPPRSAPWPLRLRAAAVRWARVVRAIDCAGAHLSGATAREAFPIVRRAWGQLRHPGR